MGNLVEKIQENGLVAIARGLKAEQTLHLAEALQNAGLKFLEITFVQSDKEKERETLQAIEGIRREFEGRLHVGAGTVLTKEQVDLAADAGAEFILSPNVEEQVIRQTKARGLISVPGAMTPTEIIHGYDLGGDIIKIFPAGSLGASYFKDILGPISAVPMMAVGGVSLENIPQFVKVGVASFGIGGNIVNRSFIEEKNYKAVEDLTRQYVEKIEGLKNEGVYCKH